MKAFLKRTRDFFRKQKGRIGIFALVFLAVFAIELATVVQLHYIDSLGSLIDMVSPEAIVDLTNQNREEFGIGGLEKNDLLTLAAQLKAFDMAEKGYFSHTSPEGITPWYWFNLVGYGYSHAGENLAVNFTDSYDIDKAWMESPTHKKNIINAKFDEIGVGTAVGEYKGKEVIFVVQLFGTLEEKPKQEIIPVGKEDAQSEVKENVLGVEDPIEEEKESFIYIDKNEEEFLYEEVEYVSFFKRITAKPLYIYLIAAFSILIVPIFLKITFRPKTKFLSLLICGIIVFIVIMLALLFNNSFFA